MPTESLREKSIRRLLAAAATTSLLALGGIMLFLFMEGLPLFRDYSVGAFLFGTFWYPTAEPPEFGIFPLLIGSLAVTALRASGRADRRIPDGNRPSGRAADRQTVR